MPQYPACCGRQNDLVLKRKVKDKLPITFRGFRIWIHGVDKLNDDDAFKIRLRVIPELEDPELKAFRWLDGPLHVDDESNFYNDDVIAELRSYFSIIDSNLNDTDISWSDLDTPKQELVRSHYFQYLLRKRHTRRILLDTNNVMLTLEVDNTKTLEPYKDAHRIIDVLSAIEDLSQKSIDNERRQLRIDYDMLGDPEIEKVTVVAAPTDLADIAALDGITPDHHEEETNPDQPDNT